MSAWCMAAKLSIGDPRLLIALGSLALVLIGAAVIFALLDRWRKRELNESFTAHDQLASFRVLYERGELSREEYQNIREQLMVRLKRDLHQEMKGVQAVPDPQELPTADESRPEPEQESSTDRP